MGEAPARALLSTINCFPNPVNPDPVTRGINMLRSVFWWGFRNPAREGHHLAIYPVFRIDAIDPFVDVLDSRTKTPLQ